MGLKGTHFTTMENVKSNATAELQKKPTAGASTNGRIAGASVCARLSYFEGH
jgi:hypothetical protein